jgi:hypothetical protein
MRAFSAGFLAAVVLACAVIVVLTLAGGGGAARRVRPPPALGAGPPTGATSSALAARERVRDALVRLEAHLWRCPGARAMSRRARDRFWACANVAVRQQVMRGRMESMLIGVVGRDLEPGRCRELTLGLAAGSEAVGTVARELQLDAQADVYAPVRGRLAHGVQRLRSLVRSLIGLTDRRSWGSCRPHGPDA